METIEKLINAVNGMVWGPPMLVLILGTGLFLMIGLRFMTPYTLNAKIIQHTIQITPRLSEPTLVSAVLVEPDTPVKKGEPLFQFDKRIYQAKVDQLKAELAAAKQNVKVLAADVTVAT